MNVLRKVCEGFKSAPCRLAAVEIHILKSPSESFINSCKFVFRSSMNALKGACWMPPPSITPRRNFSADLTRNCELIEVALQKADFPLAFLRVVHCCQLGSSAPKGIVVSAGLMSFSISSKLSSLLGSLWTWWRCSSTCYFVAFNSPDPLGDPPWVLGEVHPFLHPLLPVPAEALSLMQELNALPQVFSDFGECWFLKLCPFTKSLLQPPQIVS